MVYIAIFIFGLIIYSIFSAIIVCDLLNMADGFPFTTLDEFLENKDYKLVVQTDSPHYEYIKIRNYHPWNEMKKKLWKEEELPNSYMKYCEIICRETVAGFGIYFVTDSSKQNVNCSVSYICTEMRSELAITLHKNSPYTHALNYQILKLKEYGILDHIFKSVYGKEQTPTLITDVEPIYTDVTISDVSTLLHIMLGSILLSLIVLFFEKVHFLYFEKQTASMNVKAASAAATVK